METVKFKTNIKCANCIATVTPFLNEAVGEGNWQVDIKDPKKLLTVETSAAQKVRQAIEKAGYKAEPLNE
jgi:copper chaperone